MNLFQWRPPRGAVQVLQCSMARTAAITIADALDESLRYGREARGSRRLSPYAGQCAAPRPASSIS